MRNKKSKSMMSNMKSKMKKAGRKTNMIVEMADDIMDLMIKAKAYKKMFKNKK